MKYEAVFGNQDLFDGAPKDAEAVACVDGFNKLYYKFVGHRVYISMPSDLVWQLRMGEITHCMMTAMRRIIQEPKRWTVEDKKAGRLPEVGCMVMVTSVDECASVAAINNDAVCVVFHDGEFTTLHKSGISPIETPEEKAARLRSEWIQQSCYDLVQPTEKAKELAGFIYDALLSGALSVPTKGGE